VRQLQRCRHFVISSRQSARRASHGEGTFASFYDGSA
jgi:hypothetical protein